MSFGSINTLESKVDRAGDSILGSLTIDKDLLIYNTLTVDNNVEQTNNTATLGNIIIRPFSNDKPKISFHYNNSSTATSYIIEDEEGYLSLNKTPIANDSSKKIVTTEWVKINPVPYAYAMVDGDDNFLNIGSDKNPVYFKDGIPVATGNILNKDISGNAATATYAVDAGHAVNADEAIHTINSDNSIYSNSANNYNTVGSLAITGAVNGSANFNSDGAVTIKVNKGSESLVALPRWDKMWGVGVGGSNYTMTTDAFIYMMPPAYDGANYHCYITSNGNTYDIPLCSGSSDCVAANLLPVAKGDKICFNGGITVYIIPIQ